MAFRLKAASVTLMSRNWPSPVRSDGRAPRGSLQRLQAAAADVGHLHAERHRAILADIAGHPGERDVVDVVARAIAPSPGLSEARDRTVDQPGVEFPPRFVTDDMIALKQAAAAISPSGGQPLTGNG
ncbi:hypothetical protein [Paraburkholderia sacchari]|uniref:hypothetical protein n=1 Tax=Paraburkholderia sacchari TaxID=159450 RepID=UPI003D96E394